MFNYFRDDETGEIILEIPEIDPDVERDKLLEEQQKTDIT